MTDTWKRFLSPPFFLLTLLCFFLPFFAVTCGGAGGGFGGLPGFQGAGDPADVSGVQLVTGQAEEEIGEELSDFAEDAGSGLAEDFPVPGPTPSVPEGLPGVGDALPGATDTPDLGMSMIWAVAAAVVALLGIFLAALGGRLGAIMAIALGVVGAVLLFVLSAAFSSAISEFGEEVLQGEPRLGFWLAVGGFIVAAITGLIRLLLPPRAAPAPAGWEQSPGTSATAPIPPPPPDSPPQ